MSFVKSSPSLGINAYPMQRMRLLQWHIFTQEKWFTGMEKYDQHKLLVYYLHCNGTLKRFEGWKLAADRQWYHKSVRLGTRIHWTQFFLLTFPLFGQGFARTSKAKRRLSIAGTQLYMAPGMWKKCVFRLNNGNFRSYSWSWVWWKMRRFQLWRCTIWYDCTSML